MITLATPQPLKIEAARRQLGTALFLWLADLDPTSVHVLACGGGELAEALVKQAQGKPLAQLALEVHTNLTAKDIHFLRTKIWNAMKHANQKNGAARDDEELLSAPLEQENETILGVAWLDLSQLGVAQPVEAQLFTLWFLAKHGDHSQLEGWPEQIFPGLMAKNGHDQKEQLREQIVAWHADTDLLADPRTDLRPLIVPA